MEFFSEFKHLQLGVGRTVLQWILFRDVSHIMTMSKEVGKIVTTNQFHPPKTPKLSNSIWDPEMIIDYYRGDDMTENLSLMELSQKCAVLLLLSTGRRPMEIRNLSMDHLHVSKDKATFILPVATKTSQYIRDRTIEIKRYRGDRNVCLLSTLEKYIEVTKSTRKRPKVLIVTTGQGTPISASTLKRWTHTVMGKAGIDTEVFAAYSTRSAAISSASLHTGDLEKVMKMGTWKSTSTFFRYYLREVKYFNRKTNQEKIPDRGRACVQRPPINKIINARTTLTTKRSFSSLSSAIRQRASFALRRAKMKLTTKHIPVPRIDLHPKDQGFIPRNPRARKLDPPYIVSQLSPSSSRAVTPSSTVSFAETDRKSEPVPEFPKFTKRPPHTVASLTPQVPVNITPQVPVTAPHKFAVPLQAIPIVGPHLSNPIPVPVQIITPPKRVRFPQLNEVQDVKTTKYNSVTRGLSVDVRATQKSRSHGPFPLQNPFRTPDEKLDDKQSPNTTWTIPMLKEMPNSLQYIVAGEQYLMEFHSKGSTNFEWYTTILCEMKDCVLHLCTGDEIIDRTGSITKQIADFPNTKEGMYIPLIDFNTLSASEIKNCQEALSKDSYLDLVGGLISRTKAFFLSVEKCRLGFGTKRLYNAFIARIDMRTFNSLQLFRNVFTIKVAEKQFILLSKNDIIALLADYNSLPIL